MSDFFKRVSLAQNELKAPKNQYNSFGNYNYRSCEDILEAAKPVCLKHGLLLHLSDNMLQIGDRYYVEAAATLYDFEGGESLTSTASAREANEKKRMDASQITGTASSYARKYALSGLFNLDDTKDADTDEHAKQTSKKESPAKQTNKESPAKQNKTPEIICADCKKPVDAEMAKRTQDYFGVVYCYACGERKTKGEKKTNEQGNN
jgi:hypothetical protein